jgi:transposase-like protein
MNPYTLNNLYADFPDDKACLDWLVNNRYPGGIVCKNCGKVTKHHFVESRKSYSCQECGHHIHPTSGTIFHKSSTPLTLWFYAVYRIVQSRNTLSAKDLQHELGVTYKTAWRMVNLIRNRLYESTPATGHLMAEE